jgi:hypothetical protein
MKYYCIEPATKDKPGVCVLPTMQDPRGDVGVNVVTDIFLVKWYEHLASLPKFDTSCDRAGWFEGREQYQENFFQENGKDRVWQDCNKWEFNITSDEYRRKFIVPQYEEKDGPGSVKIGSPVASHTSASRNSDEQVELQIESVAEALCLITGMADRGLFNEASRDKILYDILQTSKQAYRLLSNEQNAQASVARDDDSSNADDKQKTYTESEVREIVGRTWEAAARWYGGGSDSKMKETFINTLFPSGR